MVTNEELIAALRRIMAYPGIREYLGSQTSNPADALLARADEPQAEPTTPDAGAEPVAWLSQGGDVSRSRRYFEEMGFTDLTPLYAAPEPPKEG